MSRSSLFVAAFVSLFFFTQHASFAADTNRTISSFDQGWKFSLGDGDGLQASAFEDAGWRSLDLPHDWSIEGAVDQSNPSGGAGGYFPDGIGWYRKHFKLPQTDSNHRVYVYFEGIMENSDVWINGFHLGKRPYGYVSFDYDMTGHLNFGDQENVIAVRADDSQQPDSRWYTGAGIYRHVKIIVTEPLHLVNNSAFVSTPKISDSEATIRVSATVQNDSDTSKTVTLAVPYATPDGSSVAAGTNVSKSVTIDAGKSQDISIDFPISKPHLWNADDPAMYNATVQIRGADGAVIDSEAVPFGIRNIEFKSDTGFYLNGKHMKLLGVCLHHDAGALGAAVPEGTWEDRLSALKAVGVNAIRTSHNPPSPEFLDACDHLGLLVMDEMFDCWMVGKNKFDYHLDFADWWKPDVTASVMRDRNHPSVVLWSAGNEIRDINPRDDRGSKIFVGIRDVMHELDPTRPVTDAVLQPNRNNVYTGGFAELMDVVGQNYREDEILAAHVQNPARKIIGTENHHDLKTWLYLRDNPPYIGQFLWTGFDYLGESRWPGVGSGAGLFDRTGMLKGQGYQRASWWSSTPMVQIVRTAAPRGPAPVDPADPTQPRTFGPVQICDWSPTNQSPHKENVEVYSNCDSVELTLNGNSLGAQTRPSDDSPRHWLIDYAPGEIKAVGSNNGSQAAVCDMKTVGKPAKIALTVDHAKLPNDWDDVSYVRATVVDANGTPVVSAANDIAFSISGPGAIVATDSGDMRSHEMMHINTRKAYQGTCITILRSTADAGQITLSASSEGLDGATTNLNASPAIR